MAEYVSTIIYISIFCIILELILPENKLKKYVSVLASLIILLNLISPIVNLIKNNEVVYTISETINKLEENVQVKQYDFNNLGNRLIFSSVRENLEEDIYTKCNNSINGKFKVSKVKINLTEEYMLKEINVYVQNLEEIAMAGEIIDYIADEYSVDSKIINIIKEET